jgi:hypothetical protein
MDSERHSLIVKITAEVEEIGKVLEGKLNCYVLKAYIF